MRPTTIARELVSLASSSGSSPVTWSRGLSKVPALRPFGQFAGTRIGMGRRPWNRERRPVTVWVVTRSAVFARGGPYLMPEPVTKAAQQPQRGVRAERHEPIGQRALGQSNVIIAQ